MDDPAAYWGAVSYDELASQVRSCSTMAGEKGGGRDWAGGPVESWPP